MVSSVKTQVVNDLNVLDVNDKDSAKYEVPRFVGADS